jgi:tRNA-dihydrouridine synthase B
MDKFSIYFAPIQGITDYIFRNSFSKYFFGIDKFFTPFIRFQKLLEFKKSQLNDLLPENNASIKLVPQVLSKRHEEIIHIARIIEQFGFKEINWNLGCPYPMVTNRQMGSGLLPFPEKIDRILEKVLSHITINLSVKMRLGYADHSECFEVLKTLGKYNITEIILHPRIGLQMYKGEADIEMFNKCQTFTNHKLCYNGDITSSLKFNELHLSLPGVKSWMLGRALVSDPMLAEVILSGKTIDPEQKLERFGAFHLDLFESYSSILSGPGHLLLKMQHFWEYFSQSFDNPHKVNKLIKKSNSVNKYRASVQEIFNSFQYTA